MGQRVRVVALLALLLAVGGCDDSSGSANRDASQEDAGTDDIAFPDVAEENAEDSDDGGELPFTCGDEDHLQPNQSPETAHPVEDATLSASDLYLCPGFDDYFAIELVAGGGILARIEFADRLGDLDLRLFEADRLDSADAVAVSATGEDVEEIRYESPDGGLFILQVDGVEEAGGLYDLTIRPLCRTDADCPCGPESNCEARQQCLLRDRTCVEIREPGCGGDAFEPNDRMSAPYSLFQGDTGYIRVGGAVCDADVDYFALNVDTVADVTLDLTFDELDDLDLAVLDEAGEVIGYSLNTGGIPEHIDLPRLGAGAYLVYVDTLAGGTADISYDLTISLGVAEPCERDLDCAGAPGRELCSDGGCVSYAPESPSDLGGPCDSDDDCAETAPYCFTQNPGFDDNFCSVRCDERADCEAIEGGQCLAIYARYAYCFPPCESDADCPPPFSCADPEAGTCAYVPCGLDTDCEEGQACLRTDYQNTPYCRTYVEATCSEESPDGNGRSSDADPVETDALPLTDLTICDEDDDWYAVDVPTGPSRLSVQIAYSGDADLDVYIYDPLGRTVGAGTTPEDSPEQAVADLIAAGTYTVRVDQVPTTAVNPLTTYSLDAAISPVDPCTSENDACLALRPLRVDCTEQGSCTFLEGNGEVALGDFCDSADDCVTEADLCFLYGGADGSNICTRYCNNDDDCADVPDTTCTQVGPRFSMCL